MTTVTASAPDAALVLRTRAGDRRAFSELVRRHQDAVYGMAYRLSGDPELARDLAQEAFLRMYRGLASYRGEGKFTTWAYAIVRHLCLARLKTRAREATLLDAEDEDGSSRLDQLPAPDGDPAELVLTRAVQEGVQAAMLELALPYRMALTLHYFQELSYEEIAEVLDLPLGTVKTHLYRAKAALRRILERRGLV